MVTGPPGLPGLSGKEQPKENNELLTRTKGEQDQHPRSTSCHVGGITKGLSTLHTKTGLTRVWNGLQEFTLHPVSST